jgi:trimethylamine corrinoid protein
MNLTDEEILNSLESAMLAFNPKGITDALAAAVEAKVDPIKIVNAQTKVAVEFADKFDRGEVGLPELLVTGMFHAQGYNAVKALLPETVPKGIVVLGSVEKDIHTIGKDLVKIMLTIGGYKVYDLGVDIPAQTYLDKVKEVNADIISGTAVCTSPLVSMRELVDEVKAAGLEGKVKVMFGGSSVTPIFVKQIGGDAYGKTCTEAVHVADRLMEELKK